MREKHIETAEFQQKQIAEAKQRNSAYNAIQKAQCDLWKVESELQKTQDITNAAKKKEN